SSAADAARAGARPSSLRRRRRSVRQARAPIVTASPPPPWRRLLHVRSCALRVFRTQSLQIEAMGASIFCWSMILLENRFLLFRIMPSNYSPSLAADVQNACGELRGAQCLLALDHFGGEPQIGFAAAAFEIVDQHGFAVGRRFRHAHIARDDGVIDL